MLPPLGDCLVRLNAHAGSAHRQPACSVRVPLCTCCALCAIKHMTPKHWCVRAAHEREEGVKTHRYAVLKGCRERDIVRRPLPFKLHQSYRPLPVFYSRVARNLVGSREKQCGDGGDDLNTAVGISLPRWSGYAVIVTALVHTILSDYAAFQDVFSMQAATRLPPHRPWDCAIDLLPGTKLPKGRV